MLLMVEDGIRGGITHVINTHTETNNKYMENYNKKPIIIIYSIFRCK